MNRTAAFLIAYFTLFTLLTGCVPLGQTLSPETPSGQQAATQSLIDDAQTALENNNLHQAEMHIERAVRIEPRNPAIWHTMARIKLHKQEYAQAINFCLKSNSMIGDQKSLQKENLLLMSQAYFLMGQYDKAKFVQQQAAEL